MSELLLKKIDFSTDSDNASTVVMRWESKDGESYAKATKFHGNLNVTGAIAAFEALIDDLRFKFDLYKKAQK